MLAGIEAGSSHPIAQSIIDYAKEKNVSPINFDSAEVVSGQGVTGTSQGAKYALISLKAYGQATSIEVLQGATISVLTKDGQGIGTVSLGDELKATSKELIEVLKDKGLPQLWRLVTMIVQPKGLPKSLVLNTTRTSHHKTNITW